jgi:hypothetical protein
LDTFLIEFQPKDIINGDLAKFSINLDNDFEKNIEFEIPVYEFIEFNLLDKNELKNWEISLPWLIQDSILLSNSTLEYLPNLNSLAEYIIDLDSIEISRYTLRFDHKIEIESNYDFALIWVKDSNNTLFNHKMGDYSVRGSGKQNSKQDSTLWGFHGFFKYFMSQNVILNTLNQNIKSIMFNFKSDVANNKQGWKIKNLYLRKFPYKVVSSVKNKNNESEYSIYPNPANNYLFINPKIENELTESPTQFIIYNLSGNVISRQFINNFGKINISHLTPGIYYIQFNSKIEKFIKY